MKIEKLRAEYLDPFIDYCRIHEKDHDESFLSEDELENFNIDDNVTCLLLDDDESLIGVFSIMLKRKGRVRIFHVVRDDAQAYKMLHDAMIPQLRDVLKIEKYNLFIPEHKNSIIDILQNSGHIFERYVYVLERDISPIKAPQFPSGYELKQMKFPEDVKNWATIRNEAFISLDGFTNYPEDFFSSMNEESDYIKEGTLILWKEDIPLAIIKVSKDIQGDETFGFIGPIAVKPEFQGKGFGRNMLRAVVRLTSDFGWKSSLCVNAGNEDALKLYLTEGFKKVEALVSLNYNVSIKK